MPTGTAELAKPLDLGAVIAAPFKPSLPARCTMAIATCPLTTESDRCIAALTFAESQLEECLMRSPCSNARHAIAGARFGVEAVRFHAEAEADDGLPVARFVLAEVAR